MFSEREFYAVWSKSKSKSITTESRSHGEKQKKKVGYWKAAIVFPIPASGRWVFPIAFTESTEGTEHD
jgi:hypothetical protein